MITHNVIARTFRLRFANAAGTCFAVDVDDLQYLVTAAHLLPAAEHGKDIEIQIYAAGAWRPLRTQVAWLSDAQDTIILAPETKLAGGAEMIVDSEIALGQSVYLCGFPSLALPDGKVTNSSFPTPLVRHGTMAGAVLDNQPEAFIVDGHNLPGFSGGPVVFRPDPTADFRVVGVISRYPTEPFAAQPNSNNDGIEANLTVFGNSGLTIAHFLAAGVEHLTNNPCNVGESRR